MYSLYQVTIFGVLKAKTAQNTPHPLLTPGPPKLTAKSNNIPTKSYILSKASLHQEFYLIISVSLFRPGLQ